MSKRKSFDLVPHCVLSHLLTVPGYLCPSPCAGAFQMESKPPVIHVNSAEIILFIVILPCLANTVCQLFISNVHFTASIFTSQTYYQNKLLTNNDKPRCKMNKLIIIISNFLQGTLIILVTHIICYYFWKTRYYWLAKLHQKKDNMAVKKLLSLGKLATAGMLYFF